MLMSAIQKAASDIHVEPYEKEFRVRFRIDGILHNVMAPPMKFRDAIISRIKIMSKLDIAEKRLPQDGRIKIRFAADGATKEIDFRVSTLPSLFGETIVLRVLDRSAVVFDYAVLGLRPDIVDQFQRALQLPNGIVLVTGPVGSGKTTTLYTGLLGLNAESRKIVTLEDPIEYQLRGITQSQVKSQIGLHFATMLRSVVRHVLSDVAAKGLPGDHHFYITFLTRAEGVKLSPRLLSQYPEEMTIVLQHQYWGLEPGDEAFQVTLSFNKVPERLVVPYAAITAFADPSVQFGLQFRTESEKQAAGPGPVVVPAGQGSNGEMGERAEETIAKPPEKTAPGEVVSLDSFRKK